MLFLGMNGKNLFIYENTKNDINGYTFIFWKGNIIHFNGKPQNKHTLTAPLVMILVVFFLFWFSIFIYFYSSILCSSCSFLFLLFLHHFAHFVGFNFLFNFCMCV